MLVIGHDNQPALGTISGSDSGEGRVQQGQCLIFIRKDPEGVIDAGGREIENNTVLQLSLERVNCSNLNVF